MRQTESALSEDAFAKLVDRWYGSTLRLAQVITKDSETARSVTLDVWLEVVDRLPDTRSSSEIHVQVLRAAVEAAALRLVRGAYRTAYDPNYFEDSEHRWAGWWRDAYDPTALKLTLDEGRFTHALAELDPGTAAVVVLRDVEQLPPGEVKAILGINTDEQSAYLRAGRAAIWQELS